MYEKKILSFDMKDEYDQIAYNFLERIRYGQTKFISALICEFISAHRIAEDTPIDEVKFIIGRMKKGEVVTASNTQDDIKDSLSDMESMLKELLRIVTDNALRGSMGDITLPQTPDVPIQSAVAGDDTDGIADMLSSFRSISGGG